MIRVGEGSRLDIVQLITHLRGEDDTLICRVGAQLTGHHIVNLRCGIYFEVSACLALIGKVAEVGGLGELLFTSTTFLGIERSTHSRLTLCLECLCLLRCKVIDLIGCEAYKFLQALRDLQEYLLGFGLRVDIEGSASCSLIHNITEVLVGREFCLQCLCNSTRCYIACAAFGNTTRRDSIEFSLVFGSKVLSRELLAINLVYFAIHTAGVCSNSNIGVSNGFAIDFERTDDIHRAERRKNDIAQCVADNEAIAICSIKAHSSNHPSGAILPRECIL